MAIVIWYEHVKGFSRKEKSSGTDYVRIINVLRNTPGYRARTIVINHIASGRAAYRDHYNIIDKNLPRN